ncbi:MAG: leucine--tRNA ligase [Pseudomonadota bacterium]
MPERYNPSEVEQDVQKHWDETNAFRVTEDPSREKFYCLSMFPYPSGRLHIGHVRNYTIGDVISRYQRMLGKNVLQPMGWDAFGLPAENAAIQNRVPPAKWTYQNIEYMKAQLQRLGFAYDWTREFATCDPNYYRWEQEMFTRMYQKGLAYKEMAEVNWDPVDQTVLANEQVIDGRGWRSGAIVERRRIPHWFFKITDYADELLASLDHMDGWPDAVKTMQRNWIGRSEGVEIDFPIDNTDSAIRIYTTRPDTIFGATYMAVAAEHPLADETARRNPEVANFIEECRGGQTSEAALETLEKRGVPLGRNVEHPITGEPVPIWVANFVLMSYGTGAIMAVPGHDERDHEFASKYGLPIVQVIEPTDGSNIDIAEAAFTDKGRLINSGHYDGMTSAEAFDALAEWFESRNRGERKVNYRLRDWGVSRQRYWGCPVPVITTDAGDETPVEVSKLPVVLPEDVDIEGGGSPLARLPDFVNTTGPDGKPAQRDTDTFDTFMESSWYFARFACADCDTGMLDERAKYWLPVDQYIGGIEHAILHLLYSRFYYKVLRDEGLVDSDEPFTNLLTQGMVVAETYFRTGDNGQPVYFNPADVEVARDDRGQVIGARLIEDGKSVEVGGIEKMSKSKNNGVDPQTMIDRYGADTVRLYMMFTAPPDQSLEWSDAAVEGSFRFLRRLWRIVYEHLQTGPVSKETNGALSPAETDLRRVIHQTIAKASDDIGRRYKFNTAIAAAMELLNAIADLKGDSTNARAIRQEGLETAVLILAPIVPHVAHQLWRALGHATSIIDESWPVVDESALVQDTIKLVVQVNGKLRDHIEVSVDAPKDAIEALAVESPNAKRFVDDKPIKKVIVVPGRLVNIVV